MEAAKKKTPKIVFLIKSKNDFGSFGIKVKFSSVIKDHTWVAHAFFQKDLSICLTCSTFSDSLLNEGFDLNYFFASPSSFLIPFLICYF